MSNPICACGQHPICEGCERPIRGRGTTEDDHPGTVSARQKGMCDRCRYAISQGYAPPNSRTLAATVTTLDAYMASRRNRGIPITGLRKTA